MYKFLPEDLDIKRKSNLISISKQNWTCPSLYNDGWSPTKEPSQTEDVPSNNDKSWHAARGARALPKDL